MSKKSKKDKKRRSVSKKRPKSLSQKLKKTEKSVSKDDGKETTTTTTTQAPPPTSTSSTASTASTTDFSFTDIDSISPENLYKSVDESKDDPTLKQKIEKNKAAIEQVIGLIREIRPDQINKEMKENLIKIHILAREMRVKVAQHYADKEKQKIEAMMKMLKKASKDPDQFDEEATRTAVESFLRSRGDGKALPGLPPTVKETKEDDKKKDKDKDKDKDKEKDKDKNKDKIKEKDKDKDKDKEKESEETDKKEDEKKKPKDDD